MKFDIEYIEKLAKVLSDASLTEISLEDGEQAITIRKELITGAPAVTAVAAAPAAVQAPQAPSAPAAKEEVISDGWNILQITFTGCKTVRNCRPNSKTG